MPESTYSIGPAAQKLSISQYHLRRLIESGLVDATQTPGRQWRIPAEEIERLLKEGIPPVPAPDPLRENPARPAPGMPAAAGSSPAQPPAPEHPEVREARAALAVAENRLKRRRLELDELGVEDAFLEREKRRQAEEAAESARQAQAAAVQVRRKWEEGKIERALSGLPYDCPGEIRLRVQEHVRVALRDLSPDSGEALVGHSVRAATDAALEPYYEAKRMANAIDAGLAVMPSEARFRDSPWLLEARNAARAAVAPIARRFEHGALVQSTIDGERFWGFNLSATDAERKAASQDLTAALKALPVGASRERMEEVKRRALEPHERALRRRRKDAQRQAEALQVAEQGIQHLSHYLLVGFEWDSYTERSETERELREELRPHLVELAQAGQVTAANVKDYVEGWTDERLEDEDDDDQDE